MERAAYFAGWSLTSAAEGGYTAEMAEPYLKNLFVNPNSHGGTHKTDLSRLPPHMRNAINTPAPVEANEAMAHLQTKTAICSVPGARVRAYVIGADAVRPAPRIGVYVIDPEGKSHLADIFLELDQAEVLHAALGAALRSQRSPTT